MPPQQFTPADIAEFLGIWAQEFGELLTEEQAITEMEKLLELTFALTEPLPGEADDTLLQ